MGGGIQPSHWLQDKSIRITTLLISSTIHHAFKTFERFLVKSPGVFLTLNESKKQPFVLLVEFFPVLKDILLSQFCLGRVKLPPALLTGRVEEEDDGEGRGEDGVVIQIFPPDACSEKKKIMIDICLKAQKEEKCERFDVVPYLD